ncbi:MAG TPA: hypothetical protein VFT64_12015 [Rickettsiales bacterium]|nr:hypothetical protein [Rickettsiales bacterium]
MFGLMKILRRETDTAEDRAGLSSLKPGCTVGFGFIPQRNISGCRMEVKAVQSYMFGDDTFLAYTLTDENSEINLIAARDTDSDNMYLSLSQKIESRLFPMLFLSKQPEQWFTMNEGDIVNTSLRVMGMQQSWVAPSYRLAILSHGSVLDGDYRELKKPYNAHPARHFEYALLVDDDNEHALEAEKYEDGTLIVYSTVYRPATDIGAITRPSGDSAQLSLLDDDFQKTKAFELPERWEKKSSADVISISGESLPTVQTPAMQEPVKESPRIDAKPEGDFIALESTLAGKVIREAQQNNISLAALIRKVIDLPEAVNDEVMVSFSLSEAEKKELADRYKLKPSEYEEVKKHIIKELQQFVGNKK